MNNLTVAGERRKNKQAKLDTLHDSQKLIAESHQAYTHHMLSRIMSVSTFYFVFAFVLNVSDPPRSTHKPVLEFKVLLLVIDSGLLTR